MTKLYVNTAGFSPTPSFTPTAHAAWDNTASATVMGLDVSTQADTSYVNYTADNGATAAQVCRVIAVSPPLSSSGHLWSTAVNCSWNVKACENALTQNAFTLWSLGVLSNDGSSVLWQTSLMKDGSEVPATTPASRLNNAGYTATANYTSVVGDRVFVELGWDKDAAIAGNLTITLGYVAANGDLSTVDGNTGSTNSFIDITTHTLTFSAEGATTPTGFNGLMMMGMGT